MKEENQNVKERELTEDQIDFRALLFTLICFKYLMKPIAK